MSRTNRVHSHCPQNFDEGTIYSREVNNDGGQHPVKNRKGRFCGGGVNGHANYCWNANSKRFFKQKRTKHERRQAKQFINNED